MDFGAISILLFLLIFLDCADIAANAQATVNATNGSPVQYERLAPAIDAANDDSKEIFTCDCNVKRFDNVIYPLKFSNEAASSHVQCNEIGNRRSVNNTFFLYLYLLLVNLYCIKHKGIN